MTALLIFFFLAIFYTLGLITYKGINYIFNFRKRNNNPYITYHKIKFQNDKNYSEYLDWLSKNGGDIPVEKVKTKEEIEADKKIKKLIS